MSAWSRRPEPDRRQPVAAAAENAVRDIDDSSSNEDAALVEAFLWIAWPTLQAQNQ
jgi:hypothetical protein